MKELFAFARRVDDTSALVRACVLHYELEFIHPFSDGNGRVGRLWQHALLCRYSRVFAHVPVESLIKTKQKAYYDALARSDRAGDATTFVVFMLEQLHRALEEFVIGFRPVRLDSGARLRAAAEHFAERTFSRRDYLALHRGISQATASRDQRLGVAQGALRITGDKATARYEIVARRGLPR